VAASKNRTGRNPLEMFNQQESASQTDTAPESGIGNQESGLNIQESRIENQQSRIKNHENLIQAQPTAQLYALSVRVPESLNDALDEAVKQTRRSVGRKIRKEVLVSVAVEAMLAKVASMGGWGAIASEQELRQLLGLEQ
jgi:ribosome-binding ATPase YchF (GTP1/OBG family)